MAKRLLRTAAASFGVALALAQPAVAQIGAIVSPGQLSNAHATVEGLANCQKCHTPGRAMCE